MENHIFNLFNRKLLIVSPLFDVAHFNLFLKKTPKGAQEFFDIKKTKGKMNMEEFLCHFSNRICFTRTIYGNFNEAENQQLLNYMSHYCIRFYLIDCIFKLFVSKSQNPGSYYGFIDENDMSYF